MRKRAAVCLLVLPVVLAGCVSDSPATATATVTEAPTATVSDAPPTSSPSEPMSLDSATREELIEREETRIRDMLSKQDYDEYGVGGGVGTYETDVLERTPSRLDVRVSVPYSYSYTQTPEPIDDERTATPVETTGDAVSDTRYIVNESGISRAK